MCKQGKRQIQHDKNEKHLHEPATDCELGILLKCDLIVELCSILRITPNVTNSAILLDIFLF